MVLYCIVLYCVLRSMVLVDGIKCGIHHSPSMSPPPSISKQCGFYTPIRQRVQQIQTNKSAAIVSRDQPLLLIENQAPAGTRQNHLARHEGKGKTGTGVNKIICINFISNIFYKAIIELTLTFQLANLLIQTISDMMKCEMFVIFGYYSLVQWQCVSLVYWDQG